MAFGEIYRLSKSLQRSGNLLIREINRIVSNGRLFYHCSSLQHRKFGLSRRRSPTGPYFQLLVKKTSFTSSKFGENCLVQFSTMAEHQAVKADTLEIFHGAIQSVLPKEMIETALTFDPHQNKLEVKGHVYKLKQNVFVVGFGKAVLGMARAVEDKLSDHLVQGILSVPVGIQQCFTDNGKSELLLSKDSKLQVYEGACDNLPDTSSLAAAEAIERLVSNLDRDQLLIVLISGGGSALLPSPQRPITLEDEMNFTRSLAAGGANINELNTIRKNIEVLKGGGLADKARPAQVLSLILSDVIGDPLDVIASGPTVMDLSTPIQCLSLIQKFGLVDNMPTSILQFLKSKSSKDVPKREPYNHVQNVVVGSNAIALAAACKHAEKRGYLPFVLSSSQQGIAKDVGEMFAKLARFVCLLQSNRNDAKMRKELPLLEFDLITLGLDKTKLNELVRAIQTSQSFGRGVAVIAGGETTVNIQGTGRGGRNQEMALSCAIHFDQLVRGTEMESKFVIQFLSGGTDGIDGPTDSAGATVAPNFCDLGRQLDFDPLTYLENNDSFSLFSNVLEGACLIRTGHTGTNVMDLHILLIKSKT